MIETIGIALLWLLALAALAAYPFTELARGMASNPSAHERSKGAALISTVGIALIALLLTGCATTPAPVIEERVTTVAEPVMVYPVQPAQVPPMVAPLPPRPPSPSAALDVALAKICELVGYMLQADPLVMIASGQKPRAVTPFPQCEDPPK